MYYTHYQRFSITPNDTETKKFVTGFEESLKDKGITPERVEDTESITLSWLEVGNIGFKS